MRLQQDEQIAFPQIEGALRETQSFGGKPPLLLGQLKRLLCQLLLRDHIAQIMFELMLGSCQCRRGLGATAFGVGAVQNRPTPYAQRYVDLDKQRGVV